MVVATRTEELLVKASQDLDRFRIPFIQPIAEMRRSSIATIEHPGDVAPYIEHTALKPDTTRGNIVTPL